MRKLLVGTVLGALVLAACGDKSSSKGAGGSKGGGSDFASLLAKANAAKYKVTYTRGAARFTIAQDPPRFSYTSSNGSRYSATYVTPDGSAVSCSGGPESAPPTSAVAPTCTAQDGGGDAVKQGLISSFGAAGALFVSDAGTGIPGLAHISKTSPKSIA